MLIRPTLSYFNHADKEIKGLIDYDKLIFNQILKPIKVALDFTVPSWASKTNIIKRYRLHPLQPDDIYPAAIILSKWSEIANIQFVTQEASPDLTVHITNTVSLYPFAGLAIPKYYLSNKQCLNDQVITLNMEYLPFSLTKREKILHHEFFHTLGGKHGFQKNDILPIYQQNTRYSIMNYAEAQVEIIDLKTFTRYHITLDPISPTPFDIKIAQYLFGVNKQHHADDTYYILPLPSDYKEHILYTIYDAGGIDTFDLRAHSGDVIINLNQGPFHLSQLCNDGHSKCQLLNIAFDSEIENVLSGTGNSVIIPNEFNTQLDVTAARQATIIRCPYQAGYDEIIGFNLDRDDKIILLAKPWDHYTKRQYPVVKPVHYELLDSKMGCWIKLNKGNLLLKKIDCNSLKDTISIQEYPIQLSPVLSELQKDNASLLTYLYNDDKNNLMNNNIDWNYFNDLNEWLNTVRYGMLAGCCYAMIEKSISDLAKKRKWTSQQYSLAIEAGHFLSTIYCYPLSLSLPPSFLIAGLRYYQVISKEQAKYGFMMTNILTQLYLLHHSQIFMFGITAVTSYLSQQKGYELGDYLYTQGKVFLSRFSIFKQIKLKNDLLDRKQNVCII